MSDNMLSWFNICDDPLWGWLRHCRLGLVETCIHVSQPAPTCTVSTNPTMGHHIISKQESILSLVAVIAITLQNTPLSQLQIQTKHVPNNLQIDLQKSIKQQQLTLTQNVKNLTFLSNVKTALRITFSFVPCIDALVINK